MDTPWAGKLSKANHCGETAQTILERIGLIMWCEDAKKFFLNSSIRDIIAISYV